MIYSPFKCILFRTNSHNDRLPVGLIAQLVEHSTGTYLAKLKVIIVTALLIGISRVVGCLGDGSPFWMSTNLL